MIALKYISVRFAMVLENLGPLIVALLGYVVLKEKTSVTELVNMTVCFGVVVLMTVSSGSDDQSYSFWDLFVGIGLTLISLVMFCGTYVINRFLRSSDAVVVNAQNMLFSAVISFILCVCSGTLLTDQLLYTLLFGFVNGVFGFFCSLTFIMASQR
jgi:drug/metabolite transporter (DMT)-like permease